MTTIANIVGARPQFIKAGPVSRAIADAGLDEILIHTGQHYDPLMSEEIMRDVGLRQPDLNLGVGSGTHAAQTGQIMIGVEDLLRRRPVEAVVVYGDTNSTVAAALAATKSNVTTAHVEAGLRSFNRSMPEEINRMVTDRVADVLFAPTETAMRNLRYEGLAERSTNTGDVMLDALQSIDFDRVPLPDWAVGEFCVVTIHRPSNTDDEHRLRSIIRQIELIELPTYILAHPRLRQRMVDFEIDGTAVEVLDPLPYAQMMATLRGAQAIVTDSGGLQKEAFLLGTRCVTLRQETEWPETVEAGWNVLAEPSENLNALVSRSVPGDRGNPFGDGRAAKLMVDHIIQTLS